MNYKLLSTIGMVLLVIGFLLALASSVTDDFTIFAWSLFLWFAGFGVIYLADRVRRKENQKNPITTVEATVVGHRMETHHTRYSHSQTFYMTFKPDDGGDKLEFEVPEADYQDFDAGDKGPLRYRTWEYLSFCAKDMSEVEPISPLPEEYDPDMKEVAEESGWDQAEKLLDLATEKTKALWQNAKERCGEWRMDRSVQRDEAAEKEDVILTHELDEK